MSQAGGKSPLLTLISHQFPASLMKRASCQIVACIQSGLALAKARVIEGSRSCTSSVGLLAILSCALWSINKQVIVRLV